MWDHGLLCHRHMFCLPSIPSKALCCNITWLPSLLLNFSHNQKMLLLLKTQAYVILRVNKQAELSFSWWVQSLPNGVKIQNKGEENREQGSMRWREKSEDIMHKLEWLIVTFIIIILWFWMGVSRFQQSCGLKYLLYFILCNIRYCRFKCLKQQ